MSPIVRLRPALVGLLLLLALFTSAAPRTSAALSAPTLVAPSSGSTLPEMTATMTWDLPSGSSQYHLQVLPVNGDGPSLNLIRNAEGAFTIPAPPTWYVLLPDLTYTWRVQATDSPSFAPESDPSWSAWSETRTFRTPATSSVSLTSIAPTNGGLLTDSIPLNLRWAHPDPAIFYYEIQVSGDNRFDPDPASATSFVWWNLVHGGVTNPANSWRTPALERAKTYYWRVRPRVQGDGAPLAWGPTWTFRTPGLAPVLPPSPGPYRIAFTSKRDGNSHVYLMNADGSNPRNLTSDLPYGIGPVWSPDASKIAFISTQGGNSQIFVMNPDGSDKRNLSNNDASETTPVWSPDGSMIAFASTRDGNSEIYVMNADGSNQRNITNYPTFESGPAWSPDGNQIAFTSLRNSDSRVNGASQVYVMNADGSGVRNVTNNPAISDAGPVWSPDGAKIAFISQREGVQQIYVMNADGTNPKNLTNNRNGDVTPAWSPDGRKIAFRLGASANYEIFVMNADGSELTNLTNNPGSDERPAWSPNGALIAFDRSGEIYTMSADGTNQKNLTNNSVDDTGPVWSPR